MAYEAPIPGPNDDPSRKKKRRRGEAALPLADIALESTDETAVAPNTERSPLKDLFEGIRQKKEADQPKAEAPAESKEQPKAEKAERQADGAAELESDQVIELTELEPEEERKVAEDLIDAHREQATAEDEPTSRVGEFLDAAAQHIANGEDMDAATGHAVEDAIGETPEPAENATQPAAADAVDYIAPGDDAEDTPDDQTTGYGFQAPPGGGGAGNAGIPPVGRAPGLVGGGNYNAAPTGAPGRYEAPDVIVERRGNPALAALVGGIVGYLLGRRRGRIRTERQLLPVQEALEKKVRQQDAVLTLREAQVRRFTRERADAEWRAKHPTAEQPAPVQASAERVQAAKNAEAARAEAPLPVQSAEHLHDDDLLKISETITVGATTIRRVYETNLISKEGLRRIVHEHLQGKDVRKVLTEELIVTQLKFERDPALRDAPLAGSSAGGSTAASTAAEPAAASTDDVVDMPMSDQTPEQQAKQRASDSSVSSKLLVANIVAFMVFGILVLALILVLVLRG